MAQVVPQLRRLVSTDRDLHGRGYRPVIDGYRGLFVTLVLLYHFGWTGLSGGWIGINHFFVFSGFLIGRLLIREWHRTGRVRAGRFYLRRIRRIVPALTLLVVAVLGVTALSERGDRPQTAGDGFASMTFWLNWRLVARDDQYFNALSEPSPLRHVWTLAVEEQFYIFLPLLVPLVLAMSRRRSHRVLVVGALALASAGWGAYLARHGATSSRLYYGSDVRAQALLVGLTAAMFFTPDGRGRAPSTSRRAAEVLGWVGLLGSVSAFFLLDEASRWLFASGGMLLFAVLAAVMAFSALDARPLVINRVFSAGPLVHLGQISYGLYLFHWPLAVWMPLESWPLWAATMAKLALTWVVAVLSYRLLELPVLTRGFAGLVPRAGRTVRRWGGGAVVAGVTAVALLMSTTFADALEPEWDGTPLPTAQAYTRPAADLSVAVVGSSVAQSLRDGFQSSRYPGLTVSGHTQRGSCNPLPLTFRFLGGGEVSDDPACALWRETWPAEVRRAGADVVLSPIEVGLTQPIVTDGAVAEPGTPEHARVVRANLDALLAQTKESGARQLQLVTATCHDHQARVVHGEEQGAVRIDPGPVNAEALAWTKEHAEGQVAVALLDLDGALCRDGFREEIDGVQLYGDRVHFSRTGAKLVWTWLAPQVVTAWSYRRP